MVMDIRKDEKLAFYRWSKPLRRGAATLISTINGFGNFSHRGRWRALFTPL